MEKLQDLYLPDRDYSESEALNRGIFWYRQGHIFASPFYYIDYTLAQVCALQFWKRTQVDHDEKAWEDYIRICDLGGTKSFLQVVEAKPPITVQRRCPRKHRQSTDWLNAVKDDEL